ncbi:MAG: hypothetical protein HND55_03015 [Pseudomonadota bacterium]|nr:MAG: hypothetical protein HND55_03015 [Pseudomonadota bacterium]
MKEDPSFRHAGRLLCAALLLALGAGCQQDAGPPDVEARAEARWNHLIEGEYEQARAYYSPGFRELVSEQQFRDNMRDRPLRWLAAEVLGSECEEKRCTVWTEVTYRAIKARMGQDSVEIPTTVEEPWIQVDGQWWYAQD